MGMTQVCERYNLKLLTYGSLVRSSAPPPKKQQGNLPHKKTKPRQKTTGS